MHQSKSQVVILMFNQNIINYFFAGEITRNYNRLSIIMIILIKRSKDMSQGSVLN